MNFLYHAVPTDFQGTTIYPLNRLKEVYPIIYQLRFEKYSWRPQVMRQPVHTLNCLWNDCVFLMAVHPQEVIDKLRDLGYKGGFPQKFWKINASLLNPDRTTIYNFGHNQRPHPPEDYLPFDPKNLKDYAVIPGKTIDYWQNALQMRSRLLLYMYIPHIMYNGEIEVNSLEKVHISS